MNLSAFTPFKISANKIIVDKPTVFLTFPDTNVKLSDQIYNTNFLITNCDGIISPPKIIKFGVRRINGKTTNLELKKQLLNKKSTRRLPVFNGINVIKDAQDSRKYYYYDLSTYSQAVKAVQDKIPLRRLVHLLFTEIQTIFQTIKSNHPNYNIEMLFLIKNPDGFLYQAFQELRVILPKDKLNEFNFYDTFSFVSTSNKYLIPLLKRVDGKNDYIIQNIKKLDAYLVPDEFSLKDNLVSDEEEVVDPENLSLKKNKEEKAKDEIEVISQLTTGNPVRNLVKQLSNTEIKTDAKISEDGDIEFKINTAQLKKMLKKNSIDDPDILSNVKVALDNYIKTQNENEKITKDNAEILILKAINKTIHGTDKLREEYVHEPKLLFDKLKNIDTHKVPLRFPAYENELIQPKDIIDLNYTCGQHRQKFEFSTEVHQNVERLFKTLEEASEYPVKVKKITHEVVDNNSDRLIKYKVTLQNMVGGHKKSYEVEFNIPGLVSDRYFKLHGNHYIMKTQQHLKPVTKTDPDEVRILSPYAIIRVLLVNMKFELADINKTLDYIELAYPNMIVKRDEISAEFHDGDIVGLAGERVFSSHDGEIDIRLDPDTNKLMNKNGDIIHDTRFEYQLNIILQKLIKINPTESDTRKTKLPYLEIYLGGIRIPLILYLWSQKGLLSTLNDSQVEYELVNEKPKQVLQYLFQTDEGWLIVRPKSLRQKYLLNGLLAINLNKFSGKLNDPATSHDIITGYTKSSGDIRTIKLMTENQIDPITRDLLEFEGLSTNFVNLVSKDVLDILFDQSPDNLSDLSIYRTKLSELIFAIMYKQIKMAHNNYRRRAFDYEDEDAKIEFVPDHVINSLLGDGRIDSGSLQNTEPYNPVEEIMISSRVVRTGRGGVPSKRAFKLQHRMIHPSSYGNLGAAATSESSDVGLVNHHTLTPAIINRYGNYGIKELEGLEGWNLLCLDEALTPFQNSMDSDRLVMARTHSNQVIPVENTEVPLVVTGAEYITGQIASSRFIHRAKMGGKIVEVVPEKYMTVKYDDNTIENVDIVPRTSKTKRGSYIRLDMRTIDEGKTFNKNDILAYTKNFNNGIYSSGKNVVVCFMNYKGYCHEDSYTISENLAASVRKTIVKPINIIIPPGTKVLQLKTEKEEIKFNDILVEFSTDIDIETYLQQSELDLDIETEMEKPLIVFDDKTIKLPSSLNGKIVDIKVFINNKKDLDPLVVKLYNDISKEDNLLIDKLSYGKDKEDKSYLDNQDLKYMRIGGHKTSTGKEFLGANIVYYVEETTGSNIGDKMSQR